MKALLFFALAATTVTIAATAPSAAAAADNSSRERRICTRIELRGASRMPYRRVCLTEAQWRERYGPDWRESLSGNSPQDDLSEVDTLSRETNGTSGLMSSGGRSRGDPQ